MMILDYTVLYPKLKQGKQPSSVIVRREYLEDIFPQAYRGYYCQHISENMKIKFGLAVRDTFWKVAKGRSVLDFNDALKELCDLKPSVAQVSSSY